MQRLLVSCLAVLCFCSRWRRLALPGPLWSSALRCIGCRPCSLHALLRVAVLPLAGCVPPPRGHSCPLQATPALRSSVVRLVGSSSSACLPTRCRFWFCRVLFDPLFVSCPSSPACAPLCPCLRLSALGMVLLPRPPGSARKGVLPPPPGSSVTALPLGLVFFVLTPTSAC